MRIGVLASSESWYLKDLQRAAEGRCEIVQTGFDRLQAASLAECRWQFQSDSVALPDLDAVLVRTMPPGTLEQVVFRMDCLARLEAEGLPVVNPPKSLEIAVDKYLSLAKLSGAGLLTPRTVVCQASDDAMSAFHALGGDIVVKPLFGGEGRGLMRLEDESLAARVFRTLEAIGAVLYLQEFVPHYGYDIRLFVLDDQIWGMKRSNPHDWRTNVSRGASTERLDLSRELVDLARSAAHSVGGNIIGVDVLPALDGRTYVLEVNAVPGWKALSRTLQVDVAARILDYLEGMAG